MEETEPSNVAIGRYLDFCRDESPSERGIRQFLRNNPLKEDVRRFIEACHKNIFLVHGGYTGVVDKDWNILLFIFKQFGMGLDDIVDIQLIVEEHAMDLYIGLPSSVDNSFLECQIDEHHRICTLKIYSDFLSTVQFRCIGHLDHLKSLEFHRANDDESAIGMYFPLDDVSKELRYLYINVLSYSDDFRRLVTSVAFPHLTHLRCHPEVSPIIHKCDSLEILDLMFPRHSVEKIDEVFERLRVRECPFAKSLRTIKIVAFSMTTDLFERILFQVVPRFPNLKDLVLIPYTFCGSHECQWLDANSYLKAAADRIRSDTSIRISKSLRKLQFPLGRQISVPGEEERLAANTFLKTFSAIDSLYAGYSYQSDSVYYLPPDLKYLLVTNMMGRRLLAEASRQNLGLWPILLEAAQNDRWKEKRFRSLRDPSTGIILPRFRIQDGIYGLLREYPELIAHPLGHQEEVQRSHRRRKRPRREL